MEWVVVTAKTVDAAKELALDQLAVAADDAEFEVLEEPRPGLFGRLRGEARVRARVRPAAVRPKRDRRERSKRERTGKGEGRGSKQVATVTAASEGEAGDAPAPRAERTRRPKNERPQSRGKEQPAPTAGTDKEAQQMDDQHTEESAVSPDEVGAAAAAFVTGLAEAFGTSASTEVLADGTDLEVRLTGEGLGLLIGPGGRTLTAVQDLARVAAQRRLGDHDTRLKVDVAGYREKRRSALEKFAITVANDVVASGSAKALEPMSSADRKVVHDALAGIDGVTSRSDGDDPARRVVISPA